MSMCKLLLARYRLGCRLLQHIAPVDANNVDPPAPSSMNPVFLESASQWPRGKQLSKKHIESLKTDQTEN